MTGGRLLRIKDFLRDGEPFCFTYGDGVSDINVGELIKFHQTHKKLATVTAVLPKGRFGALDLCENKVVSFREKPDGDGAWVNGGFFVLSKEIFRYLSCDDDIWEAEPLSQLASDGQLRAYQIRGFGSQWIRYVTRSILRNFGTMEMLLGEFGRNKCLKILIIKKVFLLQDILDLKVVGFVNGF